MPTSLRKTLTIPICIPMDNDLDDDVLEEELDEDGFTKNENKFYSHVIG